MSSPLQFHAHLLLIWSDSADLLEALEVSAIADSADPPEEQKKTVEETEGRGTTREREARVCEGWVHLQKRQDWGHPAYKQRWLALTRLPPGKIVSRPLHLLSRFPAGVAHLSSAIFALHLLRLALLSLQVHSAKSRGDSSGGRKQRERTELAPTALVVFFRAFFPCSIILVCWQSCAIHPRPLLPAHTPVVDSHM